MNPRKVAIVVGTRPEAIKMAPVYLAVKGDPRFETRLVTTAQHRGMLDQVLTVFGMVPDVDLDLMRPDQGLGDLASRVIAGVQRTLTVLKPDAVLVHGDTSTCLFAALAAFYEGIPVGHVEAGLRTYDLRAPWPEEMNRRLTDPICRWCFAPTRRAAENLRAERIPDESIFITGNTVVDALHLARDKARGIRLADCGIPEEALAERRLILVTGHRRESFGEPFRQLCLALRDVIRAHEDTVLVYPVHLNPNVRAAVLETLEGRERILLIDPVEYLTFVHLIERCHLIITDSGGIQEEAPSFGKPVLVMREVTERPEAVEAGFARLVGTSRERIVAEASRLLGDDRAYAEMSAGSNPYGDGRASERILSILREGI